MNYLLNKKLLMFTGKGGIGKSLVAGAFGQYAASQGLRTLLVERSDQEQLAPLFGVAKVGHCETKIQNNLSCINLDAAICLEEYIIKQLGQKKLFEKVFSNSLVRTFFNTIPGLAEAMILGRIFYSCELESPKKFDLVIFDAPASGHLYNLMTTPDAILNSGIGGPLSKEILRVKNFLSDTQKCAGVLVTIPEALVSSESMEFLPKLQKDSPLQFNTVFINKSVSELTDTEKNVLNENNVLNNPLKNAVDFVVHRNQRAVQIQAKLIAELKSLQPMIQHIELLPDLGVIPEPFASQFGCDFFGKVKTN